MQLFKTDTQRSVHQVVYDLSPFADKLYLPTAYIVSEDKSGMLAHIKQKALKETVSGFELELTPLRERLFQIIEQLQPKALEDKFRPPKKRKVSLEQMLEERDQARAIAKYVDPLLSELMAAVNEHQLPLTWQVERTVLAKDFVVSTGHPPLEPQLFFRREPEGVTYRLQLVDENGPWPISSRDVIPITNHPAWLFVDYKLYQVPAINGNMVKPFQKKEEVSIPQKAVKTYFQKFILKVAAKAEVEAEGFEILQKDELEACVLEPIQDLFSQQWVLSVQMVYPGNTFSWSDPKPKRTSLEFDEGDEVRILQAIRQPEAEAAFIQKLETFELQKTEHQHFKLADGDEENGYQLLEWLGENRQALESAGFQLKMPAEKGNAFYLHRPKIELKADQENDWFDLKGQVQVGEYSFPFMNLAKYIRDGIRLYPLPNGQFFLIPQEWMAKYKGLFQFGKKDKEKLRLAKSQFTLLQEIGLGAGESIGEEHQPSTDFHPSNQLKAALRPYQLQGVRWLVGLYESQLGGCLADDMGLGKTLQTITVLLHAKEQRAERMAAEQQQNNGQQLGLFAAPADQDTLKPLQSLVILPASLVFNWESEINKFAPTLQVYRHTGPKRYKDIRLLSRFDVILTTYQTALRDVEVLKQMEFEYIVLDESQYIKNKDSKVFKALNELQALHKISLSGTPIENSLSDLWAQMQFINPNLLGSFNFFKKEFIRPIERQQDEVKKEQLRKLVQPYLLRRTKEEVAKDLPPLSTKVFYSEMTPEQKRLYEREKSSARNYLLENYDADNPQFRFKVLQSLTKMRQLANHPKMAVEEYARSSGKFDDVLEHWDVIKRGGHKALIFSSFVQHLELFRQQFEGNGQAYAWLTGSLSSKEREKAIQSFSEDPAVQPFLISIKSGGTGLNLTAADYVFILDPWWNPTTEQQAIARAHRIGQDKHVIAIKFITKDTIEEKILKLQEKKSKLAEDIIGDVQRASFTKGDIEYLFA
jgi:superfamily II DNA or RNA helicase